jgi:1-acyl-sn-glycerol-3-phosphate acyltransferase
VGLDEHIGLNRCSMFALEMFVQRIRSRIFDVVIVVWTAMFAPALGVLLIAGRPRSLIRATSRVWAKGILVALRWTVGLTHVELGRQNIPSGPCLIVANHQSQWETIAFLTLVPNVAIVAKQELLSIPVMGWFLRHSPMILIDRESGGSAIRHMLSEARKALSQGRPVLIFPEGGRRSASSEVEFKRGIELLYLQLGVTVLPVALDSGLFWGSDQPYKRSGAITVSYLPPIQPGLSGTEFVRRAQLAVGTRCRPARARPSRCRPDARQVVWRGAPVCRAPTNPRSHCRSWSLWPRTASSGATMPCRGGCARISAAFAISPGGDRSSWAVEPGRRSAVRCPAACPSC